MVYSDPYNIGFLYLKEKYKKFSDLSKEDETINLLLEQYNYGLKVKEELKELLILMGIMKEN